MPYILDQSPPVLLHHHQHHHTSGKMGLSGIFRHKSSRKNTGLSTTSATTTSTTPFSPVQRTTSKMSINPFSAFTSPAPATFGSPANPPTYSTPSGTLPTRRPPPPEAPPAYQPPITTATDNRYAFLSSFDTIFLIDDSGSMAGRSWRETSGALAAITPICTQHDADGIDVYFLNHPDNTSHHNLTRAADIEAIFKKVQPMGGTPTGSRLNAILKPYLKQVETKGADNVKPLNIIVITDGVPSDDVETVILAAAKKLDKWDAPGWQVGIQFFQVGNEEGAAEALRELDDDLTTIGGEDLRDIVDTVPWSGDSGTGLNAEGIMKVVLGAVNRKLDRKRQSAEWRR